MVLALTAISHPELCRGSSWQVVDRDLLVTYLVRIALGRSNHVKRILGGASDTFNVHTRSIDAGIAKFALTKDKKPYHRDGWMFQAISWIAAVQSAPTDYVRAPHIIRADKGIDGLLLELAPNGQAIECAVVFEDKATVNPRQTISEDVWTELEAFERGDYDDVLTDEVSTMLLALPTLDAEDVVNKILWERVLRYRVSITISESHAKPDGYSKLFGGYDHVVPGPEYRRQGEVFFCQDMRKWMAELAEECVSMLEAMRASNV